jgi:hypothetical protein
LAGLKEARAEQLTFRSHSPQGHFVSDQLASFFGPRLLIVIELAIGDADSRRVVQEAFLNMDVMTLDCLPQVSLSIFVAGVEGAAGSGVAGVEGAAGSVATVQIAVICSCVNPSLR